MKNKFINLEKILPIVFVLLASCFYGQVRISNSILNTVAPNSSAFIDASSNPEYNLSTNVGKGLLYPRTDLTTFMQFSGLPVGIPNSYPSYYDGFMVFNTATSGTAGVGATEGTLCRGFWYYDNPSSSSDAGGTWRPFRPDLCSPTNPIVTVLNCPGAIVTGTLTQGAVASGVSVQVPYTGGNGVAYPAGTAIPSTTVTGLTATLQAGTLANGNGSLTYMIAGTPSSSGIAHFAISFGGQACDLQVTVAPESSPVVLNCSGAIHYPLANPNIPQSLNPPLFPGTYYTIIPFTGGTGTYGSQTIPSSGQVLGLVATLRAGQMSDHQLIFDISGQTVNSGTATFVFVFQGQVCSFTRTVVGGTPINPDEVVMCGSSKVWKKSNVGADPSNPDNPTVNSIGNYYQWGRSAVRGTGNDLGPQPGWNDSNAIPDNAWNVGSEGLPSKNFANDPCPSGFRVPTSTEFNILINNNTPSRIGTWATDPSTFIYQGAALVLTCPSTNNHITFPASGVRRRSGGSLNGQIYDLGVGAHYFSSTPAFGGAIDHAYGLYFTQTTGSISNGMFRSNGSPIRCISE
ncbi:hypothetical protein [Chryseobacterium potabilaquae]|uniref:Fibrobacter succinogenes major paralogous domain-containing protein n=1 Tax=Chryseobacterium potabilaquae TaxID=2675057 RepID=A0A6N4X231_9FLAO|nr:hypothetical protein [Chryseobacterium potabilaquae]CAA7194931.1 hypothetical protein CHRY9293_01191 [Chryseobacterium potabilaquae]